MCLAQSRVHTNLVIFDFKNNLPILIPDDSAVWIGLLSHLALSVRKTGVLMVDMLAAHAGAGIPRDKWNHYQLRFRDTDRYKPAVYKINFPCVGTGRAESKTNFPETCQPVCEDKLCLPHTLEAVSKGISLRTLAP